MEENTNPSQETVVNQPPAEGLSTLESELEAIKVKAAAQAANPQPAVNPEKKGSQLVKYGFLLLVVSILAAGVYLAKGFLAGRVGRVATTPSPLPSVFPSPTVDPFAGWQSYSESSGVYSFAYPADFTLKDYTEDGHLGVRLVNEKVEMRVLLLKGLKVSALEKATSLRLAASQLPGQKDKTSPLESVKVGERSGYKYTITSTGEIIAGDILLDIENEILRVEVKYQGEEVISKILSSFKFGLASPSASLLPKTGLFGTGEPASEGGTPVPGQPIP